MPVQLRLAGSAPCATRLHRGRIAVGNRCRLILAVALIATSLAAFLVSVLTPSSTSAVTNSFGRDSIIFPLDSRNSAVIVNYETGNVEVKGIDGENSVPDSTRPEVPFWALPPDEALMFAKREIEHAPLVSDDPDLYSPVFWNLSVFKRSYELMEKILKVYIYPDGSRPIFHMPELQGIYASEGWFMKLMEESHKFAVKDPKKAHLFYLPYSSRRLRDVVYTPGSHNIKPLAVFLREYVNSISSKYPFWNRTGGSDHFLVACHDWHNIAH